MEAVLYVLIGIMGFSILFSITGLIIKQSMDKEERKEQEMIAATNR